MTVCAMVVTPAPRVTLVALFNALNNVGCTLTFPVPTPITKESKEFPENGLLPLVNAVEGFP